MDFSTALNFVFKKEGGLSNDPTDKGGLTNYGISAKANPDVDVKNLTRDKAAEIYKARYWDPIGAGSLPDDMKLVAFDAAVNHGVGAAKKMIEASGGDTNALIQSRADLYSKIATNDPSQAKFSNGWTNRLNDVKKVTQQVTLSKDVAQMSQQGLGDNYILSKLADAGHKDEIDYAQSEGYSPAEIIDRFGGDALATIKKANATVDAQGFGTNLLKGASSAVSDLSTGAQQVGATIVGDDAKLARLNAEEAARQADPTYQAQAKTAGSKIGGGAVKMLPYGIAAAVAPEAVIPQLIAGAVAGGTSGALAPTTGDGQRLSNALTEGALGAAGGGAGAAIGKGLGSTAAKALGGDAEATALAAAAQAQGLPANAATLSRPGGFWRNVADAMPDNGGVQAFQAKADQAIATKVGEGLGLKGYAGPIDTNMLAAAEPGIKAGLDQASNISVVLPKTLQNDLAAIIQGSNNPLTAGIASNSVVKTAAENLIAAAQTGRAVAGKQLQELNSELKALVQSQGISASEKQLAGQLIGKVNSTMTGAMTKDQAAAYLAANSQYANLKAVENMVRASNNTGTVMPRQMLQAVKNGRFKNAFLDGNAPYQELAGTAADLYGPASGKGLGSLIAKATNAGSDHGMTAAIVNPSIGLPIYAACKAGSYLMGKLASSENPTLVRLLSGAGGKAIDPAIREYMAKALAGAGSASAT